MNKNKDEKKTFIIIGIVAFLIVAFMAGIIYWAATRETPEKTEQKYTIINDKITYDFKFPFAESEDKLSSESLTEDYLIRTINKTSLKGQIVGFAVSDDIIAIKLDNSTIELYDTINGEFLVGFSSQIKGSPLTSCVMMWDGEILLTLSSSGIGRAYDKEGNYIRYIKYDDENYNSAYNDLDNFLKTQKLGDDTYEIRGRLLGAETQLVKIAPDGLETYIYNIYPKMLLLVIFIYTFGIGFFIFVWKFIKKVQKNNLK